MDLLVDFSVRSLHIQSNDNDPFDRLNFQLTPFLFVLLSLVNISKLYIGSAINCFAKAEFRGGWVQYAHDYCLVEGTYYLRTDKSIPIEHEKRGAQKRVAYYQWVPFILAVQAFSFLIPHLFWRSFNWITGFQIHAIVSAAKDAVEQSADDSQLTVDKIARSLFHAVQHRHRTFYCIKAQFFVTLLYLCMKFAYLLLICFHQLIFHFFLGSFDFAFGFVRHPGDWERTGHFPRVTVCDFSVYKYAQPINFTIECVLPLNMFNEKIFVFFFFWLCFLLALTVFSIFLWLNRVANGRNYFKKLLQIDAQNERKIMNNWPKSDEDKCAADQSLRLIDSIGAISVAEQSVLNLCSFGPDLRIVFGLLQDKIGLIFCAKIFRRMCEINETQKMKRAEEMAKKDGERHFVTEETTKE